MARTTIAKNLITDENGLFIGSSQELGVFNLDLTSESFAIQFYSESSSPDADIDIVLEFSLDGKNYVQVSSDKVDGSLSPSTTVVFDFPNGSGTSFARISATVNAGDTRAYDLILKGKSSRQ